MKDDGQPVNVAVVHHPSSIVTDNVGRASKGSKSPMKTALVCGAGGFIGGHLVKRLKREGYLERSGVRGVDIKEHEFAETQAD